jgi:hypothetical protein
LQAPPAFFVDVLWHPPITAAGKLSDTPDATFTTFEINGETAADHCAMADSQITASLCSST